MQNVDTNTVEGFGKGWARFQKRAEPDVDAAFRQYFEQFPLETLKSNSEGFDAGCGSGHWASRIGPMVGKLHCIDASAEVIRVAQKMLPEGNYIFHHASISDMPIPDRSQDFGYCIGVLHHTPDPLEGLKACTRKLKHGAPFALYLYYRFDNRPAWFRMLWSASNIGRILISRMPFWLRARVCEVISAIVYWPLAKLAFVFSTFTDVSNWPLSAYRTMTFYSMRGAALDRFGTRLERRFTRSEMDDMMKAAGLERINFNKSGPYWTAVGYKTK